jgi:hypothetical protein
LAAFFAALASHCLKTTRTRNAAMSFQTPISRAQRVNLSGRGQKEMVRAKYFRVGNKFYVRFKNTKTKQDETVEIDSRAKPFLKLQPPLNGEMDVEIQVTYKGSVASLDWKTMTAVQISNSNSSSSSTSSFDYTYGLPKPWCAIPLLVSLFQKVREEFRPILIQYLQRKQGLKQSDVELLFAAAEKNYSLAFRNEEEFTSALTCLATRPTHVPVQHLNSFTHLTDNAPAVIVIHGSSVDGLRGKKKEGKGWTFDESSDVDVTIVDMTRFCWAQALGITTYANAQTIELTDIHLRLLKLMKFAGQLRLKMGGRQINFCVYNSVQNALKHSGFSLVCTFDMECTGFKIERLFCNGDDPFAEFRQKQDEKPIMLSEFFEVSSPLNVTVEQFMTNDTLDEARLCIARPQQGNHLFNDVHASLHTYRTELKKSLMPLVSGASPVAQCLVWGYRRLLKNVGRHLEFVSRDSATAFRIHNKFSEVVMTGFNIESNKENELLFGNALLYFTNCSSNFCKLALTDYHRPDRLELLIYPLKKAFVTLLDCAVDRKLVEGLRSSRPNEAHALKLAAAYVNNIAREANQIFKAGLDTLLDALNSIETHVYYLTEKSDGPLLQFKYDLAFELLYKTRLSPTLLTDLFDPLGNMKTEDRFLWK